MRVEKGECGKEIENRGSVRGEKRGGDEGRRERKIDGRDGKVE